MATTENTITSSTSAGPHSFTFPYIKADDVKVTKNGTALTKVASSPGSTEYTQATTSVTLGAALVNTDKLRIYRSTSDSDITATFYPGSAIRSADLNDNFTQNLYSTQENTNEAASATTTADAAVVTADAATATANTASTNASTAVSTANTATTTANSAVTTANTASSNATTAVNTANAATTTANSAVTTANSAVTTANAATTTANAAFQRDGSATMTGNIVFEGATDDGNETTLTVTDPTADRTITLPNVTGTVVTTGDTGTVALAMMAANSVDSDQYVDGSIDRVHLAADIIDGTKVADDSINSEHLAANSVGTLELSVESVTNTKLGPNAVSDSKIIDDAIKTDHYSDASIENDHLKDLTIESGKIKDDAVITDKINDNAVTIAKLGCEETTLTTNSNTTIPTSKAVNDHVVSLIQDIGGFYPIDDDQKFPNTNPDPNDDAGTIVSIADAGGLVVNGSGVSTTGRTLGGSTVTINGIDSTLYSTTIAAGKGMLVQTTSTLNTYTYHRLILDEAGVAAADTLITDFNQRYRVNAGEPSSHLTDGDLVFDTTANKMKVYDSSASAWKEVTSAGDYKLLTILDTDGSAFDGANQSFNLKDGGSAASVQSAGQLLISVNGVIQKPNSGTSAPTEGFALVDGDTIIFSNAPGAGASVFVTQIGSATTINTPANNSVTEDKIASAAVTTAKIADDAVDGAKLANNIDIAGTLDVTGNAVFDAKIGIGHTSPSSLLDVRNESAAGNYAYFEASSDGGARGLQFSSSDNGSGLGAAHKIDATSGSYGKISLATGGTDRLTIGSSGAATFAGDVDIAGYIKKNTTGGALCTYIGDTYLRVYSSPTSLDDYKISLENTGAATFAGAITSSGLLTLDDTGANAGIQLGTGADFTVKRVAPAVRFNAGADLDHYEFCIGGTEKISFNADGGASVKGDVNIGDPIPNWASKLDITAGTNQSAITAALTSNTYKGIVVLNSSGTDMFWANGEGKGYFAGGVQLGGTGAANHLDDYEEGSWTPALSSDWTNITYTIQRGRYIKIGNMVYIYYILQMSAATSPGSGYAFSIFGLPFQGYDYLAGYFTGAIASSNLDIFNTDEWKTVWYGGANTSFSFVDQGNNGASVGSGQSITSTSHGYISGHLIYSADTF